MAKTTIASMNVRLGVDGTNFAAGLDRSLRSLDKFSQKMSSVGQSMSLYMTAPLLAAGGAAIKAAVDAEETQSKFQTVFTGIGDSANAAATNLRDSYGLSRTSAEDLLSSTGDLLTGLGMQRDMALSLSQKVAQLGVDLASFSNYEGGAKGAAEILTKAMLGERDALKSLGIVITEDAVKSQLAAEGKSKLTGMALLQAKAEATLTMSMQQSKNAIGDYARTQDSAANQVRVLKERLSEVGVAFGKELLPAFKEALTTMSKVLASFNNLSEGARGTIIKVGLLAAAAGPVIAGLSGILAVIPKLVVAFRSLTVAIASNPIGLLVTGLSIAAGALLIFGNNSEIASGQMVSLTRETENANKAIEKQQGLLNDSFKNLETKSLSELQTLLAEINRDLNKIPQTTEISIDTNTATQTTYTAEGSVLPASPAEDVKPIKNITAALTEQKAAIIQLIAAKKAEASQGIDLIKLKEQELKIIEQTPAATEKEIAARNSRVEVIKEEIDRLKELRVELKRGDDRLNATAIPVKLPNYALPETPAAEKTTVPLSDSFIDKLKERQQAAEESNQAISDSFQQMAEAINSALNSSIVDMISLSAQAAVTGSGFDQLPKAILGTLGDLAIQVGTIAITTGAAVAGIKKALETLNPIVAVVAGVALIALGAGIKASLSSAAIPNAYATGTDFAAGGVSLVGERGPELVQLPRGAKVIPNHQLEPLTSGQVSAGKSIRNVLQNFVFGDKKQSAVNLVNGSEVYNQQTNSVNKAVVDTVRNESFASNPQNTDVVNNNNAVISDTSILNENRTIAGNNNNEVTNIAGDTSNITNNSRPLGVAGRIKRNTRAVQAALQSIDINPLFTSKEQVEPYATGTDFATGGVSLVGERGPELVNLPRGAKVIPNHQLEPLTSGQISAGKSISNVLQNFISGDKKQSAVNLVNGSEVYNQQRNSVNKAVGDTVRNESFASNPQNTDVANNDNRVISGSRILNENRTIAENNSEEVTNIAGATSNITNTRRPVGVVGRIKRNTREVQAALQSINVNPLFTSKELPQAYATGTDYATGGTALMGERGPELVELPGIQKSITNRPERQVIVGNNKEQQQLGVTELKKEVSMVSKTSEITSVFTSIFEKLSTVFEGLKPANSYPDQANYKNMKFGLAGSSGPERINPFDRYSQLAGSQQNDFVAQLMPSEITLKGEFVQRGSDLVYTFNKAIKLKNLM